MDIKVEKTNNLVNANLNIKGEEWKELLEKSRSKLIANLELKGFRKGKVPAEIANQNIKNEEVLDGAVNLALDKYQENILKELEKEEIVTRPEISIDKISDNEVDIRFSSYLLPEIKLPNFDDIKIAYKEKKITEKEVDSEVDNLRNMFETTEIYKDESHKLVKDDIANINFIGKVDGKEFEGGASEEYELKIGSNSFIDNFEDQLIGMKKNDQKVIIVKFPNEYPVEELAGKNAEFDVKINSISKKTELKGEELNKKLQEINFKSMDDLKTKLKDMLIEREIAEAGNIFFEEFVSKIMEKKDLKMDIPEPLIKNEVDHEYYHFKERLSQQGLKASDYFKMLNTTEEKFKEEKLREQSEKKLKTALIYSKLLEVFEIKTAEKDEIASEYQKIADSQNMKVEEIKEQINEESIVNSLIFNKLIEKLRAKVEKK